MHSDINVNAFLIQLMPECFAPTDLFVKNIFDTTRIGLLYPPIPYSQKARLFRLLAINAVFGSLHCLRCTRFLT